MYKRLSVIFVLSLVFFSSSSVFACSNAPVASIATDPSPATVDVGQTMYFTGSGTDADPGDTIVAYQWNFPPEAYCISGENTATPECKFSPDSGAGTYSVGLKVKDSTGLWSTEDTVAVTVNSQSVTTWYVKTDGDNHNNGTSWATAFRDIQVGIDTAVDGNTVEVAAGTYYESVRFKGVDVEVKAADGTAPDEVVIIGSGIKPVVTFKGSENAACKLTGFTVTTDTGIDVGTLLSHWKLDETSGANANDSCSTGDNDGTLHNFPTDPNPWGAGKIDNALRFDGIDDYISSTLDGNNYDRVCVDLAGSDFTFACWIKSGSSIKQFISAFNASNGDNRLLLGQQASDDNLYMHDGSWRDSGTVVFDDNWHHIAYSLDDTNDKATIYVDGNKVYNFICEASIESTDLFSIGQEYDSGPTTGDFYDGLIDDVLVYSEVLNESQVRHIYEISTLDAVAHWKLDDSGSTAADSSDHGRTGTLNGDPQWSTGHFDGALDLDEASDYVEINQSVSYTEDVSIDEYSISLWFKTSLDTVDIPLFSDAHTAYQESYGRPHLAVRVDKVMITGGDSAGKVYSGTDMADNQWHHVVGTVNATTDEIQLYVDGVYCGSRSDYPAYPLDFSYGYNGIDPSYMDNVIYNRIEIGGRSAKQKFFGGSIDDVRVYSRVLNFEEVSQIHQSKGGGIYGGGCHLAHWKMDETNPSGGNSVKDEFGGNDGTPSVEITSTSDGYIDGALTFDSSFDSGVGKLIDVSAHNISLTDNWSISCWVRTAYLESNVLSTLFGDCSNTYNSLFYLKHDAVGNEGRARFKNVSGSYVDWTDDTDFDGQWRFITLVADTTGVELYLDGESQGRQSISPTLNINEIGNGVGYSTLKHFGLNGLLDDLRIFNRMLNANEISQLYQCSSATPIKSFGSLATISNCIITGNTATNGGGIYNCDGSITNCMVADNTASVNGGGMYGCDGSISNCTIVNNTANYSGGGLYGCDGTITNSIIWGNESDQLADCSNPTYSCIEDWTETGSGNISPANVYFVDEAEGDYSLKSYSQCIDAGNPDTTHNESGGGVINMGAYGGTSAAASEGVDNDTDGLIDDWETDLIGGTSQSGDADNENGDGTGDGFSNTVEYMFGYDPTVDDSGKGLEIRCVLNTPSMINPVALDGNDDPRDTFNVEFYVNKSANVTVKIKSSEANDYTTPIWESETLTGVTAGDKITIEWPLKYTSGTKTGMYIEPGFFDVQVTATAGTETATWSSADMGSTSPTQTSTGWDTAYDKANIYKNIPLEITSEVSDWCKQSITVIKDDASSTPICNVITERLLKPGSNTFEWYGMWNTSTITYKGRICREDYTVTFATPSEVEKGAVKIYYDPLIQNLRCTPYRVISSNNEVSRIYFDLLCDADVIVEIYDPSDSLFASITGQQSPIQWDGTDDNGRHISVPGLYVVEVCVDHTDEKVQGKLTVHK